MADDIVEVDRASATSPVGVVRLVGIRSLPLSVDEVVEAVADPAAGGTTVFIGTVRSSDDGRDVVALRYEAHPDAVAVLSEVAEQVAAKHHAIAVAAVHRTGLLAIGDLAVVVAVAAGHRGEAFAAGKELIDEVKARVPIWKQQSFADGAVAWVGIETTLDVEG
jgi:molybdopterin synthase catalytic subunit